MEHYRKLERMYRDSPTNEYFGTRLSIEKDRAQVSLTVRRDFHHAAGAMHGSIYFKVLDDATFFAANSRVTDVLVLTARFEIDFLRPVASGEIRGVGELCSDDGHRIVVEGALFDDQERLVGKGKGFFARSRIALESVDLYR